MRKLFLLFLVCCALTSPVLSADDLQLRLTLTKSDLLPFEPFWFTATFSNPTDRPITLSFVPWQLPRLISISSDGNRVELMDTDSFWRWPTDIAGGDLHRVVIQPHANLVIEQMFSEWCGRFAEPGVFRVSLIYSSSGRVVSKIQPKGRDPVVICADCWGGEIVSNEAVVTVASPTGEDAKVYERYFAPVVVRYDKYAKPAKPERRPPDSGRYDELVANFPSSTYAAWIRLRRLDSRTQWWFKPFTEMSKTNFHLDARREEYVRRPHPNISEDEQLPSLVREAKDILKQWPTLEPAASIARVDLATLLYICGDTTAAREQLETAAKTHPDWEEGRVAQKMLDVISSSSQQAPAAK